MRKHLSSIALLFAFLFIIITLYSFDARLDTGAGTNDFARFKTQFESGNTNAPWLALNWFSKRGHFYQVTQAGELRFARNGQYGMHMNSRTDYLSRQLGTLDAAHRFLLNRAIQQLPPGTNASLPQERQILVGGIRSNAWFQAVYDRANVPPEVERLFEITGAELTWFIPEVTGRVVAQTDKSDQANSFSLASDAPVAVSTGSSGLQVWNLADANGCAMLPLEHTPFRADLWSVATLLPGGRTVIFTGNDNQGNQTLCAFDWQKKTALWETGQAEVGNTYAADEKTFAVGNQGRALYLREANRIEHWDTATGAKVATLITNESNLKYLQSSRDGKYLTAGFGDDTFVVWRTDTDELLNSFKEPAGTTGLAFSPDGRRLALCTANPRGNLVIWDLPGKVRNESAMRLPDGSFAASSLYWSPDGKWLAARVETYPASIVIYETGGWKPVAQWHGEPNPSWSRFGFRNDGVFLQLRGHEILGLELTKSQAPAGDQPAPSPAAIPAVPETEAAVTRDADLRDFQARVKQAVDPFKLQRLALPLISQFKPGSPLREYDPDNADFFRQARQVYGYGTVEDYGTRTGTNAYITTGLVIKCRVQAYQHTVGLVIGNRDFAGPNWNNHFVIIPWVKGVYFWEKTQVRPTP